MAYRSVTSVIVKAMTTPARQFQRTLGVTRLPSERRRARASLLARRGSPRGRGLTGPAENVVEVDRHGELPARSAEALPAERLVTGRFDVGRRERESEPLSEEVIQDTRRSAMFGEA